MEGTYKPRLSNEAYLTWLSAVAYGGGMALSEQELVADLLNDLHKALVGIRDLSADWENAVGLAGVALSEMETKINRGGAS